VLLEGPRAAQQLPFPARGYGDPKWIQFAPSKG
jgi:hypothetical protein